MERLFNLDAQLLHDTVLLAIAVFVLFLVMSNLLFNPARKLLNDRRDKIAADIANATSDKEEAAKLKAEYEEKLKAADKEAEAILSEARQKAQKNETKIVAEAKEEAAGIIARANTEAELEKKRVADEVKQEMVSVASLMAQKVVTREINADIQNDMIEQTLNEMGDNTWRS